MLAALVFVVVFTLLRGFDAVTHLTFFIETMKFAGPLDPLDTGGIAHAIVGTLIQISIALAIAVPLGIATAVFMNEIGGRFARFVRTISDAMTALPSIVAGLFIYAAVITLVTQERSGFAAVARDHRDDAADHHPRLRRRPPARAGEPARGVLCARRIAMADGVDGRAADVPFGARDRGDPGHGTRCRRDLAGPSDLGCDGRHEHDPFHGPMISLPLQVFDMVKSPEPSMIARGFGAAATLIALVLVLFIVARAIGGKGAGQLSPRRRRARAAASRGDLARIERRAALSAAAASAVLVPATLTASEALAAERVAADTSHPSEETP